MVVEHNNNLSGDVSNIEHVVHIRFGHADDVAANSIDNFAQVEWQKWNVRVLPQIRSQQIKQGLEDFHDELRTLTEHQQLPLQQDILQKLDDSFCRELPQDSEHIDVGWVEAFMLSDIVQ